MIDPSSFGAWIKVRRRALDLTQEALARQVGCATESIRKIEAGVQRPSKQIAERLADCLAIPADERAAFVRRARAIPVERRVEEGHRRRIKGYELGEQIGIGTYGTVHTARQPAIGRDVAIKLIRPEFAGHPDFIRRFEVEAQTVGRLEHPFIVPLFDYWRDPGGAYLVMRWMRGGNLRALIESGTLSLDAMLRLLEPITGALESAHCKGIVHRDLKPANILLDESRHPYLADFGIARDLWNTPATGGNAFGNGSTSRPYSAPEQIRGEPATPRSDIYSLGVLVYELLAGSNPRLHEQIANAWARPLPHLSTQRADLPAAIDSVVGRATADDPSRRYSDVRHFYEDLQRVAAVQSQSRPTAIGRRQPIPTEATLLTNPYKGLRAFQEADAADFFGREAQTQHLLARLAERSKAQRFLAVVGPSGSGKSSLVRAGLIPALRSGELPGAEQWFVVEMVPGQSPLDALEAALLRVAADPPSNLREQLAEDDRGLLLAVGALLPDDTRTELVLVVDQFEEVFTLVENEIERQHFLNSLVAAVRDPGSRARVLITLRADFFDRPLQYPTFGELVRQRTAPVVALSNDEVRQAITGPAERVGLHLEPGLIDAVMHDVSAQPGALPLLQYALTELVEQREGMMLTLQAYQESGGVIGALSRRADALFAALTHDEQGAARQLFLRLVALGEGVEDTRRRVRRAELAGLNDDGGIERLIDRYVRYRLLTVDRDVETREPTVELAHEALICSWERLRAWLDESRAGVRLQRQLASTAAEWVRAGRDRGFLLTGKRLDQFETWRHETDVALTAEEQDFLAASVVEYRREERAEQERRARERRLEHRSRRVLQVLASVLLVATLGALGLTAFARNNAVQAERSATLSRSLALASAAQLALREEKTDQALALALAATDLAQPPALAQRTLFETAYAPGPRRVFQQDAAVAAVSPGPDGRTMLSTAGDGSLILWDTGTGTELRRLTPHRAGVESVAWSPDGRMVLTSSDDTTVALTDAASGTTIRRFEGHTALVSIVKYLPDGRTALSGSDDHTLIVWDLASGRMLRQLKGHTEPVYGMDISPDGRTALSGALDKTMILWDVATGTALQRYTVDDPVASIAFNRDGKTALLGFVHDPRLAVWDGQTGQITRYLAGHTAGIWTIGLSRDGQRVVTGSFDTTVIVWDREPGVALRRFRGHTRAIRSVAFMPDEHALLSGSNDRTARLWDLDDRIEVRAFKSGKEALGTVAASPDSQLVLTRAGPASPATSETPEDPALVLWEIATGRVIRRLEGHGHAVRSVTFSPDGRRALSGAVDQELILWDVVAGAPIRRMRAGPMSPNTGVWSVAMSPDGRIAASVGGNVVEAAAGHILIWDLEAGREVRRISFRNGVNCIAFTPDGRSVLAGFGVSGPQAQQPQETSIGIFDVATGEQTGELIGHTHFVVSVAVSPDGRRALSSSLDGTMRLWDLLTGRELRRFVGHESRVTSVAFSTDGALALSGSYDASAIVWDVATGDVLRRYVAGAPVNSVAFSADGAYVFTAADDGKLQMWRLARDLEDLVAWTRSNRYVRALNCSEREQYQVTPLCGEGSATATAGSR